jgi:AcrR family transcriptional regulator
MLAARRRPPSVDIEGKIMPKAMKSKEEIIKDIDRVFRRDGFAGATLSKLTEATGLERASLYHYFPKGKKDMGYAVTETILQELSEKVLEPLRSELPGRNRLEAMLNAAIDFYKGGDDLCLATVFVIGESSPQIKEKLAGALKHWLELIDKAVAELEMEEKNFFGQRILATVQGGLVVAHGMGHQSYFKECLDSLKTEIAGY